MRTSTPAPPEACWYLLDAAGQSLGRLASCVAHILRGKHRASWSPHHSFRDHVVIINVEGVSVGRTTLQSKMKRHHTGTIGHLKEERVAELLRRAPDRVFLQAVKGMLPATRLRPSALRRLHVYRGDQHPHRAQVFHSPPSR